MPLSPSPISPPSLYNMSQYGFINYEKIIQQQQKQFTVLQTQLQALQIRGIKEGASMEKFVQEFRRAARESRYENRLLVEEFKRGINATIR